MKQLGPSAKYNRIFWAHCRNIAFIGDITRDGASNKLFEVRADSDQKEHAQELVKMAKSLGCTVTKSDLLPETNFLIFL